MNKLAKQVDFATRDIGKREPAHRRRDAETFAVISEVAVDKRRAAREGAGHPVAAGQLSERRSAFWKLVADPGRSTLEAA